MEQELNTFIPVPDNSDFTIYNIPFGSVSAEKRGSFAATIIGNTVIDLVTLEKHNLFDGPLFKALGRPVFGENLNGFIQLTKPYWTEARRTI